jgi:hypothetical protein
MPIAAVHPVKKPRWAEAALIAPVSRRVPLPNLGAKIARGYLSDERHGVRAWQGYARLAKRNRTPTRNMREFDMRPVLPVHLKLNLPSDRISGLLIVGVLACGLAGCGRDTANPEDSPNKSATAPAKVDSQAAPGSTAVEASPSQTAGPSPTRANVKSPPREEAVAAAAAVQVPVSAVDTVAPDETVRIPATVAEAARSLDLQTFPVMAGVDKPIQRVTASLYYQAPVDAKTAFEFQRRNLRKRNWKELPNTYATEQMAGGQFARDGFVVSVLVSAGSKPGEVTISLRNHGNVNLRKLPVPSGAKLLHAFPNSAMFVTDAGVRDTAAAVRKLLLEQGWQPYGKAGETAYFKQNAVKVSARVFAPPAQPGKTAIDFASEQLSADLPVPPDAEPVQYADQLKQLNFEAQGAPDVIVAFYRSALGPAGWKATTDESIKDRFEQTLIFRNNEKDMLTLKMRDVEKKTRATVRHQSAAEVAELDRLLQAQAEARKKKQKEEQGKPKPKALVTLPTEAHDVEAAAGRIEFKVTAGKAKTVVGAIATQLQAAGWKAEPPTGDNTAGQLSLSKEGRTISIDYVDPSLIPAEVTIRAPGVDLERASPGNN